MTMLSLASNGLMPAEQLKKSCFDPNKEFKKMAKHYFMTYIGLSSSIPVVSAGAIAALGRAPLRNSMKEFKNINRELGKKLFRTTRFTAPLAVGYHTMKKHSLE